MIVTIHNLEDLNQIVSEFATNLSKRDIVLFSGPMGAGKTTFIQCLVRVLGGKGAISPTFSIHNEYLVRDLVIDHFDLFRLDTSRKESREDLEATGILDLFQEPTGLILVEWPEKAPKNIWPTNWKRHHIEIELNPNGERTIKW